MKRECSTTIPNIVQQTQQSENTSADFGQTEYFYWSALILKTICGMSGVFDCDVRMLDNSCDCALKDKYIVTCAASIPAEIPHGQ